MLAVVQQESTFLYPKFTIKDSSGQIILRVEGPGCRMRCGPVRFKITSHVGLVEVGAITRQWLGFCRECTSDANNLKITFPQNLDVKMKAAVLGACFLIVSSCILPVVIVNVMFCRMCCFLNVEFLVDDFSYYNW